MVIQFHYEEMRPPGKIRTPTAAIEARMPSTGTGGVALGAGIEPASSRLTGERLNRSATPEWSSTSESNRVLAGTGRARRQQRLRSKRESPSAESNRVPRFTKPVRHHVRFSGTNAVAACAGGPSQATDRRRPPSLEPPSRIELDSPAYRAGASPTTLQGQSARRESNPRRTAWKAAAWPLGYARIGVDDRGRTGDLHVGNVTFFQLNYIHRGPGEICPHVSRFAGEHLSASATGPLEETAGIEPA